jgi:PAS domain S-box-containing protein
MQPTDDTLTVLPPAKPQILVRREPLNRFALWMCGIVAAIAALVIVGWGLDIESVKRLRPSFVAMNPTSALCFLLSATAIALCTLDRRKLAAPTTLPWALGCAAIVFIIGSVKLVGLFLNFDTGVDRLLFSSRVNVPAAANPMAPNTAVDFVFIGLALLFLRVRQRRLRAFASLFASIAGFGAFVAILGYLYRIGAFYGIGSSIPMAPHTAACFVLVSGAIVAVEARRGLWVVFLRDNAGARMARRLFPAALLIPAATSWLSLLGERIGLYNSEFGLAFASVTNMAALGAIICCSAVSLSRSEIKRSSMERRLRRGHAELENRVRERTEELLKANEGLKAVRQDLEERVRERTAKLVETQSMLQGIADHAGSLIYVKDIDGKFVLVNAQVASLFGVPETDVLGRSGEDFYPKEIADGFRENDLAALRTGTTTEFEESLPKPDGLHTYISSKFPSGTQPARRTHWVVSRRILPRSSGPRANCGRSNTTWKSQPRPIS